MMKLWKAAMPRPKPEDYPIVMRLARDDEVLVVRRDGWHADAEYWCHIDLPDAFEQAPAVEEVLRELEEMSDSGDFGRALGDIVPRLRAALSGEASDG